MADFVVLSLLLFFVQLGIGGGLYEALVVYPRWKHDPKPAELPQKLSDSGQLLAVRFWPLPSIGASLMSIINIVLWWRSDSTGHWAWLTAALIILLNRIVTFAYFVPALGRFQHSGATEPAALRRSVARWTTLSPMRIGVEFVAVGFGVAAIFGLWTA